MALGLNVWQCMTTVIIGNLIVGVMCVLSGAPGATWHIGFPVIQRACWGTAGFKFVIVQRFFLACIWFSTQAYWGGQCLRVVVTSLVAFHLLNEVRCSRGTRRPEQKLLESRLQFWALLEVS